MMGRELAVCLEAAELGVSTNIAGMLAANGAEGAEVVDAAGGKALFFGPGSPLSQVLSAGMTGPVTEAQMDRLETFFLERRCPVVLSLCPFADPSLPLLTGKRGYRISHFENTMVRELPGSVVNRPDSRVREATLADRNGLARAVIAGFSETGEVTVAMMDTFLQLFGAPGARSFAAFVNGEVAGGGGMSQMGEVAVLYGDATMHDYRGRGLHTAVIAERLRRATESGCSLAMSSTLPGSVSQRNYERAGFQVAYTKTMLIKD